LNSAIQDDLNCKKKKENYKTILEETLVAHFKGVKAKAERALAKAAAGGATKTTREQNKLIDALKLKNQAMVSGQEELNETIDGLKEEMKKQDATISKLQAGNVKASQSITTLKTTLDERDFELFRAIREGKDYVVVGQFRRVRTYQDDPWEIQLSNKKDNERLKREHRDENIEHWRSKNLLKRKATKTTEAPPAKQQKKVDYNKPSKVVGSRLLTKEEEERAKRLKAIESRGN
jgi:hypothetical protein